jgi:hypothetical protein
MRKLLFIFIILCISYGADPLLSQGCNQWPLTRCIGNGLDFVKNNGQSAQFMNLNNNATLNSITNAMTVEMWIKPNLELGKRNYFAGKWGPTLDKSDVWQLYYDKTNRIVFELNHPDFELGDVDNTVAKSDPINLNGEWHHLAAVFDGSTNKALIYLDGELVAEETNSTYPISTLMQHGNNTQFGRANEMSNDNSHRTFRGVMDEIKLWNIALPQTEIICEKDKRRNGNENGLIAYFRCNENPGVFSTCDVTGNNKAILLSGLTTTQSKNDRPEYRPFVITSFNRVDTIKCERRKKYSITVMDTSLCGSRAFLWIHPDFRQYFDYSGARVDLPPNQPVTFEFYVDSDFIGSIRTLIRVIRDDVCGYDLIRGNDRWWTITRETELKYNVDTLGFGILKAHCIEEPYREKKIKVCNNTNTFGTSKNVTITGANFNLPQYYSLVSPSLPVTLAPGECVDLTVRFTSRNEANIFYDTLRVQSTDICEGAGIIPLTGEVENILSLVKFGTEDEPVDSLDFGTICKDFPSDEELFYWENLSSQNITVTNVIVPDGFQFVRFNQGQPQVLEPEKSYQVKLIRFVPKQAGDFQDTVFIVVDAGGCTLKKPILVSGKSIHPDLTFTVDTVDFGNVFVGQERERTINIRNNGVHEFTVSFSLSRAEVYYFPGGRFATIPPGEEKSVRVRFRPLTDSLYFDKLCFQETPATGCYSSGCITLKGRGIIDKFEYNPDVMKVENVIACQDSTEDVYIINKSPVSLDLDQFSLNDPQAKFNIIEPVSDLASLNTYNTTLSAGDSILFRFRYTPNDLISDRVDKAYLSYRDNDDEEWTAQIVGSSALPKLFMEDNNAFGTIEVGETPTKEIILENISSIPVHLDSLNIGAGFRIIYPNNPIDITLNPRDTIHVVVQFEPSAAIDYSADLISYSSFPCPVENRASFSGRGKIIPLEIINTLVTFGFVKNCECETASLVLSNNSRVNDAIIDSIWIDGVGVIGTAYPNYYSWESKYANNGNEMPYIIPPLEKDSVKITYCPKSPSIRDSLDHSAMMHIAAHGVSQDNQTEVWRLDPAYNRYLAGRQTLVYEPTPLYSVFPPTVVDTFAAPNFKRITIPGISFNPDRERIVIDSITFEPDENVFFASDSLGRGMPITYSPDEDTLMIRIDFKPRVYRDYEAKVKIHFSEPCEGIDTTMTVFGSGFATPFTMPFDFKQAVDTITNYDVISCDTLYLPIFASRQVPAKIIDIDYQVHYDTTLFDFIGIESNYLGFDGNPEVDLCTQYDAKVNAFKTDSSTVYFELDNFCQVDSITPLCYAKFTPIVNQTVSTTFVLDSFKFDSKGVIIYELLHDRATIDATILNSDFSILNDIDFDTVNVLDCRLDTFRIENIGDVPYNLSDVINLPPDVTLISIIPDITDTIYPGMISEVIIEFCPKQIGEYSSLSNSIIVDPCLMIDSNNIQGYGYAPPFELLSDVDENGFSVPDTLHGLIGDTVIIPLFVNNDVMAVYNGETHWMIDMSFDLSIEYDPYSLMYMEASNSLSNGNANFELINHGNLNASFTDVDTLRAGQVAEMKMLVTIPKDTTTLLDITIDNFGSEYIYFLDIFGAKESNLFNTGEKCEISHIVYRNRNSLKQNYPNPFSKITNIEFELVQKGNPILEVYDASGRKVKTLLNGNKSFEPGSYNLVLDSKNLLPGNYFYLLKTENGTETKKLLINK